MGLLQDIAALILVVLIEALFVHLAALVVLRSSQITRAITVAVVGSILGFLVFALLDEYEVVSYILVSLSWMIVCMTVYRTTWVRAIVVGVLAYVMWIGTKLLVEYDWARLFR